MTADINTLLKQLNPQDRAKLTVHHNAVVKCTQAYNADPTASRLRDLRAAEEALAEEVQRAQIEIGDGAATERFKHRAEALAWIKSRGVALSSSKFYADCDSGKVAVYPDKTVSKFSTACYLDELRAKLTPGKGIVDARSEKEALELRKLKIEVEKLEISTRREDKKWMAVEDHWRLMAGLLVAFVEKLDYQAQAAAPALCELAGGEIERAGQLVDRINEMVGAARNELCGVEIENAFFGDGNKDSEGEE